MTENITFEVLIQKTLCELYEKFADDYDFTCYRGTHEPTEESEEECLEEFKRRIKWDDVMDCVCDSNECV